MISVVQLGALDYAEGLRLQRKLVDLRKAGQIGDVLLLLEHSPVITLGRNAKAANVLASTEVLAARGVEVFECDRGGDVTFHGPGQLVGYPIFDLRGYCSSQLSALNSQCEHTMRRRFSAAAQDARRRRLRSAAGRGADPHVQRFRHSDEARRRANRRLDRIRPVWGRAFGPIKAGRRPATHAAEAKIAAIGVHISRSVTSHGFALNVNTDLSYFNLIVPCGITAKPVTSMRKELGREVELNEVAQSVSRNFGTVFASQMLWVETIDALLGNAVGVPAKVPAELRAMHGEDDIFMALSRLSWQQPRASICQRDASATCALACSRTDHGEEESRSHREVPPSQAPKAKS